jgi:hypothetical protein
VADDACGADEEIQGQDPVLTLTPLWGNGVVGDTGRTGLVVLLGVGHNLPR